MRDSEMIALYEHLVEGSDFAVVAEGRQRGMTFECHHFAYLAWRWLQMRGHHDVRWTYGKYRTKLPKNPIHHSWLEVAGESERDLILELDAHQLSCRGGYADDRMPCPRSDAGRIVMIAAQTVLISTRVSEECNVIVDEASEIMARYGEYPDLLPGFTHPDFDCQALDELFYKESPHEVQNRASDR